MDSTTLETINNSINQLNFRIDDLNNRVNETNNNIRRFTDDNNKGHRNIEKQIDIACRLITNVDKQTSLNKQKINNHISSHDSENKRREIMGVRITSLIGNFGSAVIGAGLVLYIS